MTQIWRQVATIFREKKRFANNLLLSHFLNYMHVVGDNTLLNLYENTTIFYMWEKFISQLPVHKGWNGIYF